MTCSARSCLALMARGLACLMCVGTIAVENAQGEPTPPCRLDVSVEELLNLAVSQAIEAFKEEGLALPFEQFEINTHHPASDDLLTIEVVQDATIDKVDKKGCYKKSHDPVGKGRRDELSVRGGCYISGELPNRMRCSSRAVKAFLTGSSSERAGSPALLYVVAHELAHIHQGRRGEFAGKIASIDLRTSRESKIQQLVNNCAPGLIAKEEDADRMALVVLQRRLQLSPYVETNFSPRGSMYWNIDRIRMAANEWDKVSQASSDQENVKVHRTFDPNQHIELPASLEFIRAGGRRFVCDVLRSSKGRISYPVRQTTHPSAETRLRRIAEALEKVAADLPESQGTEQYVPLAKLQEDVSPIFAFFDREYGAYTEKVHSQVCSIVNGDAIGLTCR